MEQEEIVQEEVKIEGQEVELIETDTLPGNPDKRLNGRVAKGNQIGKGYQGAFSLTHLLKRKLQDIPKGERKSHAELIIEQLLKDARKGKNSAALKLLMNYVEGMPKASVEITNVEGVTLSPEKQKQVDEAVALYLSGNKKD